MGTIDLGAKLVRFIEKIAKEQKAAEKAGDIETALQKNKELKSAIQAGVNDPAMPRAKPLSDADIQAYAERMAPQVAGELTRGKSGAKTVAGKTQQQFQREKTLPVDRRVLQGQRDPMAALPEMTLEQQKGGVLLGLPGDPTLARMQLSGIGDVAFERPVTLHGGPRYGDDEKLWASNIAGASNLVGAGRRASEQYGGAPVFASFMQMPEGFGFAQHYLDSLLQYTRPDQLPKAARLALEKDIRKGFKDSKKSYEFPEFAGFGDLEAVSEQALRDSKLRGHIADRLEKSKLYGLRPAGDVKFAVTHPELTNIETGAGGFTIGELPLNEPFSASAHPTYTHDIPGKVLGQTRHPTPYDLLYRDQLEMVKRNPTVADEPFGTVKLLGARQQIDEQLINEINEYQERLRRLIGKKKGGEVNMAGGGAISKLAKLLAELPAGSKAAQEAVAAEIAARKAAQEAAYAAHTLPSEIGKKELSKSKEVLKQDVNKAEGGAVDWHTQLGQMLKNPEPTWYDQLGEMMMAEGGSVKMAEGGQTFPLKDPEEEQRRRMMEGSDIRIPQKYPTLVKVGEGIRGAHEFISKPFGYENPPGEFVSELLGIPAVGKTLEDIGYGMPLTTGSGMTSNVRPEVAEAALTALPIAGKAAQMTAKAAPKVAKKATEALAPTVADLLETQLQKSGMMMSMAPEGKAAKVKAPADDLGFYSNVEKAALNLQRKSGTGDSFLADLMKNPGVSESKLEELGLTALRGKKNVTADEVRELAATNKPQLTESVAREYEVGATGVEDAEYIAEHIRGRIESAKNDLLEAKLNDDHGLAYRLEQQIKYDEEELANLDYSGIVKGDAKFGPETHPDYNMPGGKNYREIRVKLKPKMLSEEEARVVLGAKPNARLTETDIRFASRKNKDEFMHTAHHGNEPDVLFHLRVADHADVEGKKGLLIDELQSDWHQAGREKGYGKKLVDMPQMSADELYDKHFDDLNLEQKAYLEDFMEKWESADYSGKKEDLDKLTNQYQNWTNKQTIGSSIPDAPFKENWYQLGLKRAIKEATDTGMDRVYLTTGKTQNERYDLSKQISYLSIDQKPNGMVRINASRDGEPVILKDVPKDELADYIGKDMAKKAIEDIEAGKNASYSGLDLQVGGEGMKQYYDKNYLNWLKKYAKEHGAAVGETKLAGSDEMVYYLDLNPKLKNTAKKGQSYKRGGTIKHHKYSRELQKYAEGGTISEYNTSPDRSDGGLMILEKNGYA